MWYYVCCVPQKGKEGCEGWEVWVFIEFDGKQKTCLTR